MAPTLRTPESELESVTNQLVRSYRECGMLHHLEHDPLPSREAVVGILRDLFEVAFPGYGRRQNLTPENIGFYVGGLIDTP